MEAGAITIKDLADLLFAARGRIDFYWNFYVIIVIAVIGWLVSLKRALTPSMRALVSVAYFVAAAMNLLGLYSAYTFAEALRLDLLRLVGSTSLAETRTLLEQHSYLPQRLVAIGIHLAVGTAILLVVWRGRFAEPELTPDTGPSGKPRGEATAPAGGRR